MLIVLGAGAWMTLRELEIPRAAALIATASLVTLPLLVHQLNEPQTDLPDMTWLACTSALALAARRRPILLAPAVVAAALAVGTKTTPGVLALGALGVGLYYARSELRRLGLPLTVAVLAGVVVGGIWYLRNLFQHGSPVWPFAAAPWGDPMPLFLKLVNPTLISHPIATVRANGDAYTRGLAGGVVLLAAVPVVLLVALAGLDGARRFRRALLVACGVTLVAFLAFAVAPGTGPQRPGFLFGPPSTLRYILPTLGGAIVCLGLVARAGGPLAVAAKAALVASLVWNLVQDHRLGLPSVPSVRTLALGALGGLVVWVAHEVVAARLPRGASAGRPVSRLRPVVAALATAVAIGIALAPISSGYVRRHARVQGSTALAPKLTLWLASQPGFDGSGQPIAFVSRAVNALLSGEHFTHPLTLIPRTAGCGAVRAAARRGLVVVTPPVFLSKFIGVLPYSTAGCLAGQSVLYRDAIFTVYR
jgi:hypothetical protein